MGHFAISDLEQLSGVKAHTIRMWEQRYGLLKPERTGTKAIREHDLSFRVSPTASPTTPSPAEFSMFACIIQRVSGMSTSRQRLIFWIEQAAKVSPSIA